MAWNTGITYVSTSPVNPALLNGIGNDLRVWGGNVDAGTFALVNITSISGVGGKLGIATPVPGTALDVGGTVRIAGSVPPTTGAGVEIAYTGGNGYIQTYSRTGAVWQPLNLDATILAINCVSGGKATIGITSNLERLNIGGARPAICFDQGVGARFRIVQPIATPTGNWACNAYFDGTNWMRDDVSQPASLFALNTGWAYYYYAPAGANPAVFGLVFSLDLATGRQTVPLSSIPSYANNAAATGGGLISGMRYRSGGDPDHMCIVH